MRKKIVEAMRYIWSQQSLTRLARNQKSKDTRLADYY